MRRFMNQPPLLHAIVAFTLSILSILSILFRPTVVLAQTASEPQTPRAEPTVEKIKSGFVLAPDFKFSKVDGEFGSFAGAYGGQLIDETLLIGAGVYWLANGSDAREMAYGGALVEYIARPSTFIHVSVRGLAGFGTGTLGLDLPYPVRPGSDGPGFGRFPNDGRQGAERRVLFHDDFVLAEPQANVYFNLASWLRLGLGASYRFVGATELGDRLSGASGNVSFVFGSF